MREPPAGFLHGSPVEGGRGRVGAFDPAACNEPGRIIPPSRCCSVRGPMDCLDGADALVVITEWTQFRSRDFGRHQERLKNPVCFDGRNVYDGRHARPGHGPYSVGRPPVNPPSKAQGSGNERARSCRPVAWVLGPQRRRAARRSPAASRLSSSNSPPRRGRGHHHGMLPCRIRFQVQVRVTV